MNTRSAFQPSKTNFISLNPYVDGGDASIYSTNGSSWNTAVTATTGTVRKNYVQSTLSGATRFIERGFFTFDTSSIPDSANVLSATIKVYIVSVSNANSPSYRLYTSAHTDTIVAGDYDTMTTTEASDTYLTSPTTSAYASYPLNAAGIAALNKTGYSKFCIREATYDVANTQPGGSNVLEFRDLSDGVATAPVLELTIDQSVPNTTKAYYPLNGNSTDFSGNGNHGTDTAITYPQGRFGQGALLGETSFIDCGAGASLQVSVFTFSAWVKTSDTTNNKTIVVGNSAAGSGFQWRIETTLRQQLNKQGIAGIGTSNTAIKSGVWTHVAVTYNNSTGVYNFYLNGLLDGTGTSAQTFSQNRFYIGYNNASEGFIGNIDELIVENRAWTAKEVETYYRKSLQNYKRKSFSGIFYSIVAALGTFTLTGQSANTLKGFKVIADRGIFTLTGIAANLNRGFGMIASAGSFVLTGVSANLLTARKIVANVGTFALTGVSATLKRGYGFIAETGNFLLTGKNAILRPSNIWENIAKSASSWNYSNKSSDSTFTETTKSSSTWTETDKS